MRRRKRLLLPAALVSAISLGAVPVWMIADRAAALRDGSEIVLRTEPVDPRDLLRGQYVRLNYPISQLPVALYGLERGESVDRGRTVFVRLETGPDGYGRAVEVAAGDPPAARSPENIWIRGRTLHAVEAGSITSLVLYGIERFYAEEALAPEIEKRMREGMVTDVVVAVTDDGRAQIKALRQGDRTIYTERLY